MKSLNLGNITKTLGLISAGAMLGIFLLAPLSASATHDDDDNLNRPRQEAQVVFVLPSTNGQNFTFTLVENGTGELEFTHLPSPALQIPDKDESD